MILIEKSNFNYTVYMYFLRLLVRGLRFFFHFVYYTNGFLHINLKYFFRISFKSIKACHLGTVIFKNENIFFLNVCKQCLKLNKFFKSMECDTSQNIVLLPCERKHV